MCECFFGVYPHWGLWKYLFNVKRSCESYAVGGITISSKVEVDYFNLEKLDSVQGWRKKWFYIKDQFTVGQQYGLTPFDPAAHLKKCRGWEHKLSPTKVKLAEPLVQRVVDLRRKSGPEVTGLQLIALFVKRCVQPIQFQGHPMWQYVGS